jgi:hypothetical protein
MAVEANPHRPSRLNRQQRKPRSGIQRIAARALDTENAPASELDLIGDFEGAA